MILCSLVIGDEGGWERGGYWRGMICKFLVREVYVGGGGAVNLVGVCASVLYHYNFLGRVM